MSVNASGTITYQLQYRRCGKPTCSTCQVTRGHGPYWYAYWRVDGRLRSKYVGSQPPPEVDAATVERLTARLHSQAEPTGEPHLLPTDDAPALGETLPDDRAESAGA